MVERTGERSSEGVSTRPRDLATRSARRFGVSKTLEAGLFAEEDARDGI
ncbi:hypothetical protein [Halostagnicola kamekurae]|nr:hypothetical protein [Halostagnicola kamekurae]